MFQNVLSFSRNKLIKRFGKKNENGQSIQHTFSHNDQKLEPSGLDSETENVQEDKVSTSFALLKMVLTLKLVITANRYYLLSKPLEDIQYDK